MRQYHDAEWFISLRFGIGAWRCKVDGGWAFGIGSLNVGRLSRDEPIQWRLLKSLS